MASFSMGLRAVLLVLGGAFFDVADGLAVGDNHACALLDDGSVKCFGANAYGQLGYGDTTDRGKDSDTMGDDLGAVDLGGDGAAVVAMSAGSAHTCVIFEGGTLKCFGRNNRGQLGLGDTNDRGDEEDEMGEFLPAVSLGTNRTAIAVSADGDRTCTLLDNASVRCWGDGEYGALGSGDENNTGEGDKIADSVDLGVAAVADIGGGPCAVFEDGSLSCWGKGCYGKNGQGTMDNVGDDEGEMGAALETVPLGDDNLVQAVATGRDFVCAVLQNGGLKCWGRGEGGQLGNEGVATVGDDPDEMGDMLPLVDLGKRGNVLKVSAGEQHVCAVMSTGAVKCWGRNFYGNLGLEDFRARGHKDGTMGDGLPEVSLGTDRIAVALVAGGERTCAILSSGELKCWGGNSDGQLGLGDTDPRGVSQGQMGDGLPAVALGTNRTAVAPEFDALPEVTLEVTPAPTGVPTPTPTIQPSTVPTSQPSTMPTAQPLTVPTAQPSIVPTTQPSIVPTAQPSIVPTAQPLTVPTAQPSIGPTAQPVTVPTAQPSTVPTAQPLTVPTVQPSTVPTAQPLIVPTAQPSIVPTAQPLTVPTAQPSIVPTAQPSTVPTTQPSTVLTAQPLTVLTAQPLTVPTAQPSIAPTGQPLTVPTAQPSIVLTAQPLTVPTAQPSSMPMADPLSMPTLTTHPTTVPTISPTTSTPADTPIPTAQTAGVGDELSEAPITVTTVSPLTINTTSSSDITTPPPSTQMPTPVVVAADRGRSASFDSTDTAILASVSIPAVGLMVLGGVLISRRRAGAARVASKAEDADEIGVGSLHGAANAVNGNPESSVI